MAYVIETPHLGIPPIASVTTNSANTLNSRPWQLGDIVRATDPVYGVGEFIYLNGIATTTAGTWVTYNSDDNSTTLLTTGLIGPVAVAMAAIGAGQSGWYQIQGKAIGKVAAGFVDNANVYATATAGTPSSTVVAGARVKGAVGASAVGVPSAGLAEFEIARPFMDNGLAA